MKYAVLIDFGHMFYRCFSIALQAPTHFDLIDTTVHHFKGVLRTLDKELAHMKITEYDLVFAEDRQSDRKLALLPGYRAGRTDRRSEKVRVKDKLRGEGVVGHWCHSAGNEADDVIATLVRLSTAQKVCNIVVSGDRDLWQLISPTTAVFNPIQKELMRPDSIFKVTEIHSVNPRHVALVKALWGDAGDCVPNAYPRTQKALLPLVRQTSGHLDEFKLLLEQHLGSLSAKCREVIEKGSAQVEINWQLVKLDDYCQLKWE